ncbi:MAG TPA: hypothetical protein VNI77_00455 [Nitrososphaera sp.]|nr:hypothetical protein [Nitrososphaera sp.]
MVRSLDIKVGPHNVDSKVKSCHIGNTMWFKSPSQRVWPEAHRQNHPLGIKTRRSTTVAIIIEFFGRD